jgi:hypothetical protein
VTTRYLNGRASIWFGDPDGTDQRHLLTRSESGQGTSYYDIAPRYDGKKLLAVRTAPGNGNDGGWDVDVVAWKTSKGPGAASVLDVADGNSTVTWN